MMFRLYVVWMCIFCMFMLVSTLLMPSLYSTKVVISSGLLGVRLMSSVFSVIVISLVRSVIELVRCLVIVFVNMLSKLEMIVTRISRMVTLLLLRLILFFSVGICVTIVVKMRFCRKNFVVMVSRVCLSVGVGVVVMSLIYVLR